MELFEALKNRRSIRRFLNKEVDEGTVEKLIEAATWAPSAHNAQPWDFIIIRDKGMLKEMGEKSKYAKFISQAPVAIVVCARFGEKRQRDEDKYLEYYCIQDTAAAIQNMLLAAHGLGLGACWIGDFKEHILRPLLGVPEGHNIVGIVALGYPEPGVRPVMPRRKRPEEVIHREVW